MVRAGLRNCFFSPLKSNYLLLVTRPPLQIFHRNLFTTLCIIVMTDKQTKSKTGFFASKMVAKIIVYSAYNVILFPCPHHHGTIDSYQSDHRTHRFRWKSRIECIRSYPQSPATLVRRLSIICCIGSLLSGFQRRMSGTRCHKQFSSVILCLFNIQT